MPPPPRRRPVEPPGGMPEQIAELERMVDALSVYAAGLETDIRDLQSKVDRVARRQP